MLHDTDVICALATPVGHSAIGMIRLSGRGAGDVLRKLAGFLPDAPESHRLYYGHLRTVAGEDLDEVLISAFAEKRSYTGEEAYEISCHGNPGVLARVLAELIRTGARMARPGEFTFRAFMNGRIDLARAEAVHSLIQSESSAGARIALRQLAGGLSDLLGGIERDLYGILAQVEAGIDFSTEGLELWTPAQMIERIDGVINRVEELTASYGSGRKLTEGVTIAIVGEPNVGKSSLLNALVEEDRAIVADLPGTTRDIVRESIQLDGVKVTFLDTAGLRDTSDSIEKKGIARSVAALQSADWIFGVYDSSAPGSLTALQEFYRDEGLRKRWIWVENKADLDAKIDQKPPLFHAKVTTFRPHELREILFGFLRREVLPRRSGDSPLVSTARHHENLLRASEALKAARQTLHGGFGAELAAVDLQTAVLFIDEILGKRVDEGVIDRIFKDFCLGK